MIFTFCTTRLDSIKLCHIKCQHSAAAVWSAGRSHGEQHHTEPNPRPFCTSGAESVSCSRDPAAVQQCLCTAGWQQVMERQERCEVKPDAPQTETEGLWHLGITWGPAQSFFWSGSATSECSYELVKSWHVLKCSLGQGYIAVCCKTL